MHRVLPLVLAALVTAGCPKRQQLVVPDTAEQALVLARGYLGDRSFRQAEEAFTFLIFNFPGSRAASDAQYWLAETYFVKEDFVQAQTEFDFYLKSFPNGSFQEEAGYKLGLSYLRSAPSGSRDQSRTVKAREILEDFLMLYPESELVADARQALDEILRRMAGREFEIARLYYRAGEYRSALVYFVHITDQLPTERWDETDLLRLGICYAETEQPEQARPVFEQLVDGAEAPGVVQQARSRLAELN
ncbi:MAG: outer membrane protein assembly factor BamD [candidate division WOR-3 bacterium]|nr:MAG: outer membrane protein assembly factor BamD [candidate division WOR-3 bacterium]